MTRGDPAVTRGASLRIGCAERNGDVLVVDGRISVDRRRGVVGQDVRWCSEGVADDHRLGRQAFWCRDNERDLSRVCHWRHE